MKKIGRLLISVLIIFTFGGCVKREDVIVYTDYGESWLAISSSLIEEKVYDSLMIQYCMVMSL